MSTNFPGALDSLTNPTPTSDTATVSHSSQHADANDAIEALEAKVGANSSGVTTSHDYKLSLVTGSDKALPRDAVATITNKTLGTGTKVTIGSDATGDTYYREADGTLTRVPIGASGQVLKSNGATPFFDAPSEVNRYAVSTGSANAYVVTLSPALGAYSAGTLVQFKANFTNTGACTVNVNGLGAATIKKGDGATDLVSGDIVTGQIIELQYDGANFQMLNPTGNLPVTTSQLKFGGNGSDGALTITSGATNIDLGGARFFTRNYTSISITGTGSLTFTNPNANGTIICLKSQGNVTLTSSTAPMINASGLGAAGGVGVSRAIVGTTAGNIGSDGIGVTFKTNFGNGSTSAAVGTGGALPNLKTWEDLSQSFLAKYPEALPGAGGGSGYVEHGGAGTNTSANGGRGGGALIIECAGSWTFTTASGISVAGQTAGNGTGSTGSTGGSGGGGGGYFKAMYNTLVSNTGTVTVAGGFGGNGFFNSGANQFGGGGGSSPLGVGANGTSSAVNGAKTGGDGGVGSSKIIQNIDFT